MKLGDYVETQNGRDAGLVVATFTNTSHQPRLVVECCEPAHRGLLRIYRPDELRVVEPDVVVPKGAA